MNHWIKSVLAACAASVIVSAGLRAGESDKPQNRERPARSVARRAGAATRPAFLDREHAPRPREGWVRLFNGKDLTGWKSFPEGRHNSWAAGDGILESAVKPNEHGTNIYTEKKFGDFEIYYEYLVPKNGNSGVFLRGLYEIQVQDDHGVPSDRPKDWGNGGIYGQKAPSKNVSKPQGEWQAVYATMIGRKINVWLNGVKIIDNHEPPGPTHLYGELKMKGNETEGPIVLQGDHTAIKYRQIWIRPLKK